MFSFTLSQVSPYLTVNSVLGRIISLGSTLM
jgi:hypothetical protein